MSEISVTQSKMIFLTFLPPNAKMIVNNRSLKETMTTNSTDPVRNALNNLLTSFRDGTDLTPKQARPTVEQDRIQEIINSGQEYSVIHATLKKERESLRERIAYNDSLSGDEDTLDRLQETFDMLRAFSAIELELMKPEPFNGETVLEIDVPTGKLVIADSLEPVFIPAAVGNINYGRGQHETTLQYAKDYKVASAFVGNSCPTVVQQANGDYLVVSVEFDEEKNDVIFENGEQEVAHVVTDSWSVELTDYQNWLDQGGEELNDGASHRYTVLAVAPGKYRWTVKSHADGWDYYEFPRAEFATLELIEAY